MKYNNEPAKTLTSKHNFKMKFIEGLLFIAMTLKKPYFIFHVVLQLHGFKTHSKTVQNLIQNVNILGKEFLSSSIIGSFAEPHIIHICIFVYYFHTVYNFHSSMCYTYVLLL